jgi:DNA-binding NtrC family response regulator
MSKRILVVDNDDRVLFVFQQALRLLNGRYENEIETVQSGHEALEKLRDKPFDLVITELDIANVDGIELTETIADLNPSTVVVWITKHSCQSLAQEVRRLRVYRCLDKPVEINEICWVAREALEKILGRNSKEL